MGKYNDQMGQAACTPCAIGHFAAGTGSGSCDECAVGTATPTEGSASCAPCAAGTFTDTTASATCSACSCTPDQCHTNPTCAAATGVCAFDNKTNGTGCDDTNGCTTTDVCTNGTCGGTNQTGASCSTGDLGVCGAGTYSCGTGALICNATAQASPEVCDGKDNDCDGFADEGNPDGGVACSTGISGVCAAGTLTCTINGSLACAQNTPSSTETCDGLDNNCNGTTDEGPALTCDDGIACTGSSTCVSGSCVGSNPNNATCNDSRSCTTDVCSATLGCQHTLNDAACADGNACSIDTCVGIGTGGDSTTGCKFDPALSSVSCTDNATCSDVTSHCSGTTTSCTIVTKACNDNNPCTLDSCSNPGGCVNTAGQCGAGNACVADSDCSTGKCSGGFCVTLSSIAVTPATPTVQKYNASGVLNTGSFVATATFSDNTTAIVTTSSTWSSSATSIATVGTATGTVTMASTATYLGTTSIGASYTLGGVTKTASQTLTIAGCPVVINELIVGQSGGGNNSDNEMIELYNKSNVTVEMKGYSLRSTDRNNGNATTLVTLPANTSKQMAAGDYIMASSLATWSTVARDYSFTGGNMTGGGGGLGLVDRDSVTCDAVGWRDSPNNNSNTTIYKEGTEELNNGSFTGRTLYRTPNGTDTNSNSADFVSVNTTTGTPKAANP